MHPAHEVDDQHFGARGGVQFHPAVARRVRGMVGRAQETGLLAEIGVDALHVKGVVARGDDIHAVAVEPFPGDGVRDAMAVGGVLAVHHHQVGPGLPAQLGHEGLHQPPPRFPHHIAQRQNPHISSLSRVPSLDHLPTSIGLWNENPLRDT